MTDSESAVDWQVARTLTGGDDGLLDELIEMFPLECEKHMQAIRVAISAQDGTSLTRAAHTLKSSARLFGARVLADGAQEMEVLGQSSSTELARDRLSELEAELSRVVTELKRGRPQE